MIASRTLNVGLVIEVLTDEQIFAATNEDGAKEVNLKIDVINEFYVTLYEESELVGMANFKSKTLNMYDCHINILPEQRKYSMEAGHALLEWCSDNLKGCLLYTNVPSCCDNVKQFLLKFGFEQSGILKNAWLKDGKRHDLNILTRVA